MDSSKSVIQVRLHKGCHTTDPVGVSYGGIKKPPFPGVLYYETEEGYYTRPAFFNNLSLYLIALLLSVIFLEIVLPSTRTLTLKELPS